MRSDTDTTRPLPTATVLTPEDHDHFIEHGYVVLPKAVPDDVVEAAMAALESSSVDRTGRVDVSSLPAVRACVTDRVLDAVAELFGPRYRFDRRREPVHRPRLPSPEATWRPAVHCDMVYATILPEFWAVAAFIFLTPVAPGGGAFMYAAGSPRRYRQLVGAGAPEQLWGAAARAELSGTLTEFLAEAGDVMLFAHLMGHAASPNRTGATTRHALQASFVPEHPIVPGTKPIGQMSTIERANSSRYLAQRYGDRSVGPIIPSSTRSHRALSRGVSVEGGMLAHDLLRFDGATHLFYVDESDPSVVKGRHSRDEVTWSPPSTVLRVRGPISSLHLEHRFEPTLTVVTVAAGSRTRSELYTSPDLRLWKPLAGFDGSLAGRPHFVHQDRLGSVEARHRVQFFVTDDDPRHVRVRWGEDPADPRSWSHEAVAASVPEPLVVRDLFVRSVFDMQRFALVVDAEEVPGGPVRTFVTLSATCDRYDEQLQPLCSDATPSLRQLRVYERAREYWLVSYVQETDDGGRMFWGTIDWTASPEVRPIRSVGSLRAGLCRVGLIS